MSAINFVPVAKLVQQADERLADVEGQALEKLVGQLYEERSRKGVGDFPLTERIRGYWDSADTEIDLVALNVPNKRIRFASCKRNPERLLSDIAVLDGHVQRFFATHKRYASWTAERVSIAPVIPAEIRTKLVAAGHLAQDLADLIVDL